MIFDYWQKKSDTISKTDSHGHTCDSEHVTGHGIKSITYNYHDSATPNNRAFVITFAIEPTGANPIYGDWQICGYYPPTYPDSCSMWLSSVHNYTRYSYITTSIYNSSDWSVIQDLSQIQLHYDMTSPLSTGDASAAMKLNSYETVVISEFGYEHTPLTSFTYDAGGKLTQVYSEATGGTKQLGYESYTLNSKTRYRVTSSTNSDGMGNSYTTNYSYSGALWDSGTSEFRGHNFVTVTDAIGTYATTSYFQDAIKKGLVSEVQVKDASNNLFSKVQNTYSYTTPYTGVNFIYLSQTDNFLYDGDASYKQTRTTYTYDTTYGNLTKVSSMGDVSVNGDELYSYTEYINDTTNWILGVPKHSYTNKSDDSTKVAENWNYYSNTYNGTPDYDSSTKYLRKVETAAVFGSRENAANPTVTTAYDQYGNVTSVTDALNHTTTTAYDSTYYTFPISATNALNKTAYTYYYGVNASGDSGFTGSGLFGQVKSVKDVNNHYVRSKYDTLGRSTATWDEDFSEALPQTSMTYSFWSSSTSPNTVVAKVRKAAGSNNTFDSYAYMDGLGRTLQTQSPSEESGKMVVSGPVEYNALGQVYKTYIGYKTTSDGTFIPWASVSKEKATTFTYDAVGRLTRTDRPDGTYTRTFFNDYVTTAVDANNKQTRNTVDAYGRVWKIEKFTGTYGSATLYSTTTNSYDALGRVIRTTDNLGNYNTVTYDNLGRKTAMTDMDMGSWSYGYDIGGRLTSETDAKNQTVTLTYDNVNRLTQKTFPDNTYIQYDYDTFSGYTGTNSVGKLVREYSNATGGQPVTNVYYYDALGRVTRTDKTIDGTTYTTQNAYDTLSRVTQATYPDSSNVYNTYDDTTNGSLSKIGSSSGGEQYLKSSKYDQYGRLETRVLGNGLVQTYSYDSNNFRLKHVDAAKISSLYTAVSTTAMSQISVGSDGAAFATDSSNNVYQWTGSVWSAIGGQLKSLSVRSSSEIWGLGNTTGKLYRWNGSYTKLDDTAMYQVSVGSDGSVFGTDSSYNVYQWTGSAWSSITGQLKSLAVRSSSELWGIGVNSNKVYKWNGSSFTCVSDKILAAVSVGSDGSVFATDADNIVYYWNGNGWTYIGGQLRDISVKNSGEVWGLGNTSLKPYKWTGSVAAALDMNYTYDNGGIVTGIVDNKNSANWQYTYDDGYRLTNARRGTGTTIGSGTQIYSKAYAYNTIGNITSFETNSYTYGNSAHKHAVTAAGARSYTYDDNGNMLTGDGRTLTWNYDNKPLSILKSGATTTFTYGPSGERVKKQTGSFTKVYVGSIYEKDQSGNQTVYIHAAGTTIKKKPDGSLYFMLKDHLGGTNVVTNSTGSVVNQQFYQPYGSDDATGSFENEVEDHKFTGQEMDTETGLYNYNARLYDPTLGRFISADPIEGLNRYAYAWNDPVNVTDPSGYEAKGSLDGSLDRFGNPADHSKTSFEDNPVNQENNVYANHYDSSATSDGGGGWSWENSNEGSQKRSDYISTMVNDPVGCVSRFYEWSVNGVSYWYDQSVEYRSVAYASEEDVRTADQVALLPVYIIADIVPIANSVKYAKIALSGGKLSVSQKLAAVANAWDVMVSIYGPSAVKLMQGKITPEEAQQLEATNWVATDIRKGGSMKFSGVASKQLYQQGTNVVKDVTILDIERDASLQSRGTSLMEGYSISKALTLVSKGKVSPAEADAMTMGFAIDSKWLESLAHDGVPFEARYLNQASSKKSTSKKSTGTGNMQNRTGVFDPNWKPGKK
ncbi:MAG: tectonin domain-containing protein [Nitrospirota bacterium]